MARPTLLRKAPWMSATVVANSPATLYAASASANRFNFRFTRPTRRCAAMASDCPSRSSETQLVLEIVRVGEQRGHHDSRIVHLECVGHGPDQAREMARLRAVTGELAAYALGGRVLVAKHVGMRRPAPGAEQVDETERKKRPVAEPCVARRRRAGPREAPEEHRVRQTVPLRTR